MDFNIKKVVDNVGGLLAAVKRLRQDQVLVGVPAADAARQEAGPINNAQIAYIQNYGSPAANIPARPFMEPGIKNSQDAISNRLGNAAKAAVEGSDDDVDKQLSAAGLVAQSSIRREINDGSFAPLSERTLESRRRRGRTGDKPLIDTGQLRNSINYVIRKR